MSNDDLDTLLRLARINDCEPGCHRNPKEAFRWYKIAANLRSPYAQYCVATCYADGFGVAKDDVEAFKWFLKSALQKPPGFSCAQHAVGVCYRYGRGVAQDEGETVGWLRKAAEQGLAVAQCELADAYRLGQGTSQDFEAAARWYEMAAEQGHAVAQNNIGICYERGLGMSRDLVQAYKWLRLAADGAVEPAKKAAIDIAALLSSSQFETAQRLCRQFKDKHPPILQA